MASNALALAMLNEIAAQPLVQQALADEDGDVGYSKVGNLRLA